MILYQHKNAIGVGHNAGLEQQGEDAIAMGYNAGKSYQGSKCIALGFSAGISNQPEGSFYIGTQSIRGQADSGVPASDRILVYSRSTGEITWATIDHVLGVYKNRIETLESQVASLLSRVAALES